MEAIQEIGWANVAIVVALIFYIGAIAAAIRIAKINAMELEDERSERHARESTIDFGALLEIERRRSVLDALNPTRDPDLAVLRRVRVRGRGESWRLSKTGDRDWPYQANEIGGAKRVYRSQTGRRWIGADGEPASFSLAGRLERALLAAKGYGKGRV